jgi:hypothetical protein
MFSIVSSIMATFITAPILIYIIIFVISKLVIKNHRKAVQSAIDYSTVFFILSVHFLVLAIWGKSFLWAIFIFLFTCAIIFVIINWKLKGEIVFFRVFKGFWRFCFLVFFITYLVLTIYGVIERVTSHL